MTNNNEKITGLVSAKEALDPMVFREFDDPNTTPTTKVRFSKMTYHDFGFPTYITNWHDGNREGYVAIILKKDHVVLRVVEHGQGLLTRNTIGSLPVADILAMVRDVIHATPAGLVPYKPHL